MKRAPLIIQEPRDLASHIPQLQRGDIIATRIPMKVQEEHLLLDLVERGIHLVPSATSQLASRSKVFQAKIFSPFMVPGTMTIYDANHLLETITLYHEKEYGKLVVKHDRKNAGQGIFLFNSIEDVYSLAANNSLPFPFVIQPFVMDSCDIRVIILGEYIEAYKRDNPNNFRNNLHCGGNATPCELSRDQLYFCKEVMSRGKFSYAHLDLMVTTTNETFLAEINLRGGIHGARISTPEYKEKVEKINQSLVQELSDVAEQ